MLAVMLLTLSCARRDTLPLDTDAPRQTEESGSSMKPYSAKDTDRNLKRADVFVDSAEVIEESIPGKASLNIRGSLPTPCHDLRAVVRHKDGTGRVDIELYSVFDPQKMCAQELKPFSIQVARPQNAVVIYLNGKFVESRGK